MAAISLSRNEQPRTPRRFRRWLKRAGWTVLALLTILAVFHRPLVFRGTKWLAVRLAKEQKLTLDYEIDGTIFTTLRVRHLKARPIEPGPVERLEIGELDLRYSLTDVVRHGLPSLLKEVEVHDAWIVVDPGQSVPRSKPAGRRTKFPAVFPERLKLENLNARIRSPGGDTQIEGLRVDLDPAKAGTLGIDMLDLPGVHRWTKLAARTAVHGRELVLADLALAPEIVLDRLSLDVSNLGEHRLGCGLEATLFGGTATLKATLTDLNRSNRLELQTEAVGISLDGASRYWHLDRPLAGAVTHLKVDFAGLPERPAEWSGNGSLTLTGLVYDHSELGTFEAKTELTGGHITLGASCQPGLGNQLAIEAGGELPPTFDGFVKTTAAGRVDLKAGDLSQLPGAAGRSVAGTLTARLDVHSIEGRGFADIVLTAPRLGVGDFEMTDSDAAVRAEADLAALREHPSLAAVTTHLQLSATAARWRAFGVENLTLAMGTRGGEMTVEKIALTKGPNSAQAAGSYAFPPDFQHWDKHPLHGTVEIDAPDLSAFVEEGSGIQFDGAVKLQGELTMTGGNRTGHVSATGRDIHFNGLPVRAAEADLQINNETASLRKLELVFDESNQLAASGEFGIDKPYKYQGTLLASLGELAILGPALRETGRLDPLAGSLDLSWRGRGDLGTVGHTGEGTVDLKNGRWGNHRDLAAHFTATYSPQAVHVPECRLAAGPYHAEAALDWENGMARLHELAVSRHNLRVIEGHVEFPLQWTKGTSLDQLVPDDGLVAMALRTHDLNLTSLFKELGYAHPPVAGIVNAELSAQGRLQDLAASGTLRCTGLQAAAVKGLAPAVATIDFSLRDHLLTGKGLVRQPQTAPLEITGRMPLDIAKIIHQRSIDADLPIEARVRLPSSPLDFLPTLVPQIRALRGKAGLDLRVGGTVGSPEFAGSAEADVAYLRFANLSLPPINESSLRLVFTRDEATIRQLGGGIAGGTFRAGGRINFKKLHEPVLDLRLSTSNALVMQNETVTARANSNLTLTGPFNAATLAGSVSLTNSRFLKEVEILPIGLPGRPAPKPPPAPAAVSFPNPPLRDWKFDVAIRTADPFLIQGNLARGRAVVDLKLKGTGLRPWIEGEVRSESLLTSLPFSRLEVTSGRAVFSSQRPFQPALDIRATSTIRDYQIDVYIFGSPGDPQAVFSSQPPLPQSDIVSLLATGATSKELSEDPNVLAGRAAALVFKKYYHKFFKKGQPLLPEESLFGNVQFEVGAVDPKSGRESIAVRVPLTDELVLAGGVDVGGDFRGQIKYLVRFR